MEARQGQDTQWLDDSRAWSAALETSALLSMRPSAKPLELSHIQQSATATHDAGIRDRKRNVHLNPTTPDGRYLIVKGRLWRCSNPALDEHERQRLMNELMDARRAVKAAKASGDPSEMKTARAAVKAAKEALGERGPVWWDDGAPDLNRHMAENTPYSDWYLQLEPPAAR